MSAHMHLQCAIAAERGSRPNVRTCMVEKFKTPRSRMTLAGCAGCARAAALSAVLSAAAMGAQPGAAPNAASNAAKPPAAAPAPAPPPVAVAGFSFVKSLGGIDEYRLD